MMLDQKYTSEFFSTISTKKSRVKARCEIIDQSKYFFVEFKEKNFNLMFESWSDSHPHYSLFSESFRNSINKNMLPKKIIISGSINSSRHYCEFYDSEKILWQCSYSVNTKINESFVNIEGISERQSALSHINIFVNESLEDSMVTFSEIFMSTKISRPNDWTSDFNIRKIL